MCEEHKRARPNIILRLILSTFIPVVQIIWVLVLTGSAGLTWLQFGLGLSVPFYGWYLIWQRSEFLFFM
jgi:hypothetical protein